MQQFTASIKKEWKLYIMAVWMVGVTGFLIYLNAMVQTVRQTSIKLSSDMDAIEGILISTDSNVLEMKKQINEISAKVSIIHKRIRR